MIPSILERIVTNKKEEVAVAKAACPRPEVEGLPPARDFAGALRGAGKIRLIAEVKRASPSRGVFRAEWQATQGAGAERSRGDARGDALAFDPVALSRTFAENGAAAISVLTDVEFFQGHPRYLAEVRAAVSVPVFRKEFIIDPWQIDESRALGADALLLIAALLSRDQLQEYLEQARALSLGALVEVHDEEELERALATEAPIIGVNNRNLHTFDTTLATTERLAAPIKAAGRLLVSESGIASRADLERLAPLGVDAVLVGEALVREAGADIGARVRELASFQV